MNKNRKPVQFYRSTSFMLTREQHEGLEKTLAYFQATYPSITQSDLIRDAIDHFLGEVRQGEENGKTI